MEPVGSVTRYGRSLVHGPPACRELEALDELLRDEAPPGRRLGRRELLEGRVAAERRQNDLRERRAAAK